MKIETLILLILLLIPMGLAGQEKKVTQLQTGEPAPYSGVLLPEEEYRKLYEALQVLNKQKELAVSLDYQILKTSEIVDLKNEEIEIWKTKYELERTYRSELARQAEKDKLKIKALTVTTSVGLSLALAELIGVGVFAIMYNTLPR